MVLNKGIRDSEAKRLKFRFHMFPCMQRIHQYISFGFTSLICKENATYTSTHLKKRLYQYSGQELTYNEDTTTPGSLLGYHYQHTILSKVVTVLPATRKVREV